MQKQLYEQEAFVNEQVPIRIWNHVLDQTDIHSPLHWHRSIEIDIVISGRVEYKMDGQSQYLHTGDVLIINSGMLHSNHWIDRNDHFQGVTILISKSFLDIISLASVAAHMNYSSAHLSRVFKENIGYNFHDYLQSVRIGNAVRMIMQNKDVRLMECAIENGFTNIKSFIEAFKKIYGCTPSEWRKEKNIKK